MTRLLRDLSTPPRRALPSRLELALVGWTIGAMIHDLVHRQAADAYARGLEDGHAAGYEAGLVDGAEGPDAPAVTSPAHPCPQHPNEPFESIDCPDHSIPGDPPGKAYVTE